jgi:predicted methyltransferase
MHHEAGVLVPYVADLRLVPGVCVYNLSLVFDVGANIGVFTQRALDLGARRVILVEANPATAFTVTKRFTSEKKGLY